MTGVIDVGGGLRGIFGAGVFDRLLEDGVGFDYCIGVSAGAANICSFIGGQKGRNYQFYTEYSMRPEYMSLRNVLRGGAYLNLDYIYSELSDSDGENPLNYRAIQNYGGTFKIVCTNAQTAAPEYFDKNAFSQDSYEVLKATSCLPVVCRAVCAGGVRCFDGGISDPVPVLKAIEDGCEKLVLILTKPADMKLKPGGLDSGAAKVLRKKYPAVSAALEAHYKLYNDSVETAQKLEKDGRVLIVSPDSTAGLKTLTKDVKKLSALYKEGYMKAGAVKNFIE